MEEKPPDSIIFLGTAGARFMVMKQVAASGGLWLTLDSNEILLDPGPGCLVHSTKMKLRAERLSAIILSHRHLDHSVDANIMVEAMTEGGFNRHGLLFAPTDALNDEPVLYSYLKSYLDGVEILKEGKSYRINGVSFDTPIRHAHAVETYGMVFKTPRSAFSYISDSRYFEGLSRSYAGDLIILNVLLMEPRAGIDHLSIVDAERILKEIKPRVAILTHFGMSVWQANPGKVAEKLSHNTGVKVLAARDGMKFNLEKLEIVSQDS